MGFSDVRWEQIAPLLLQKLRAVRPAEGQYSHGARANISGVTSASKRSGLAPRGRL